jgi:hypothetical protein
MLQIVGVAMERVRRFVSWVITVERTGRVGGTNESTLMGLLWEPSSSVSALDSEGVDRGKVVVTCADACESVMGSGERLRRNEVVEGERRVGRRGEIMGDGCRRFSTTIGWMVSRNLA